MIAFHYPHSFFALIAFAVGALLFLWSRWKRNADLLKIGEWRLVKDLVNVDSLKRRRRKDLMALVGLLFLILATAGPQFGSRLKEVKQRGVDVFIALDVSRSMSAEDVAPSRLERAKLALGLLIKKLEGNRVGIIAFAREAVLQCPLTVDNEAARMFLEILDENTVPVQGTAIGDAIRLADKNFTKDSKSGKALVLLTDGEDHRSDPIGAANLAKENGIIIFTLGIGTSKGEVIKEKDDQGKVTGYHRYKGEMVFSRLDEGLLSEVAAITGGRFYRSSSNDREIDEIADIVNGFDKREFSTRMYERLNERYQIFLLIALFLLIVEFFYAERAGQLSRLKSAFRASPSWGRISKWISVSVLLLLWPIVAGASMRAHVQQGNRLFKKNDLAGARGEFESAQIDSPESPILPYNIGTTYYLEGKFEEARINYEKAMGLAQDKLLKSQIAYNLGHLFFNTGKKEEAVQKFKESLRYNPNDMDAKYNIEYILAGKTPKQPFKPEQRQNDDKQAGKDTEKQKASSSDDKESQESQQKHSDETQRSTEDAERVLEMIDEQEREKMKQSRPAALGQQKDEKGKKEQTLEDW